VESNQPQPLKRMFDAVPRRYDLVNRLLTFGLDEHWRRRAARRCLKHKPSCVLDLCCGTGDLALHLARLAGGNAEVVGVDFSPEMLAVARNKASRSPATGNLSFIEGDASALEFSDEMFGAVGIAYGFRNLTWRNPLKDRALAEVLRILQPGGVFVIVETSQPQSRILRALFHAYLTAVAAPLGGRISNNRAAYHYLAESARHFYQAPEVREMLLGAGFAHVHTENLLGGVAAIHTALKADPGVL
jgi:demethylmenaquinone methyltransferase/2-methoxy-6-polyprenyl-1,4-benzoquinol methylase